MIYDYLISNYAHQENYRYNTSVHKKNELKQIYNKIVKISKDSPSYIVKPSPQTKSFVLQLKEGSLTLQDTLSKLQNGGLSSACRSSQGRNLPLHRQSGARGGDDEPARSPYVVW